MRRWIFWIALVVAIGIPAGMLLWRSRQQRGLADELRERGFASRPCPAGELGIEAPSQQVCFAGRLGATATAPVTLVLTERWRPGYTPAGSQVAMDSYVSVVVEAGSDWQQRWQARVGGGATAPIKVGASSPGTVVVVWEGLAEREFVAARLDEVQRSLP